MKATAYACIVFCIYGTLAYLAYGDSEYQLVFQLLPQDWVVKTMVCLNILILMATYPLTVFPAN